MRGCQYEMLNSKRTGTIVRKHLIEVPLTRFYLTVRTAAVDHRHRQKFCMQECGKIERLRYSDYSGIVEMEG